MVVALFVKMDLENLASVEFPVSTGWCCTVKQSSSEETRKGVFISPDEVHELQGSRGTANFVIKFGGKHHASINIVDVKHKTRRVYTAEDSGKFVPVVGFECRGVEPVEYEPSPANLLVAKTEEGKAFEVDLSEGDWCDYDERNDASVGVYNFEYKFGTV